ncbi:hypothetical protein GCM10023405_05900 [Streptomonospora salina]
MTGVGVARSVSCEGWWWVTGVGVARSVSCEGWWWVTGVGVARSVSCEGWWWVTGVGVARSVSCEGWWWVTGVGVARSVSCEGWWWVTGGRVPAPPRASVGCKGRSAACSQAGTAHLSAVVPPRDRDARVAGRSRPGPPVRTPTDTDFG